MANTQNVGDLLRSYVERVERLDEEGKAISDDKRDVYAEAKGNGLDVKALKEVIEIRRQDPSERAEQAAILDAYLHALGMASHPREAQPSPKHSAAVSEGKEKSNAKTREAIEA